MHWKDPESLPAGVGVSKCVSLEALAGVEVFFFLLPFCSVFM